MSLKDTATRVAVLDTLAKTIGKELTLAKADLEKGLRDAKAETGTQQIAIGLDGEDIGKASLVQPKPSATVVDEVALLAWVRTVAPSEISTRIVAEIRPAWRKKFLDELTAGEGTSWADPETGVIHEVPGVEFVRKASHTRLTLPEESREAIAAAWRSGALASIGMPELGAGGMEEEQ